MLPEKSFDTGELTLNYAETTLLFARLYEIGKRPTPITNLGISATVAVSRSKTYN
jgi:hypothetical protein